MANLPVLYSFRRCPYAMRARMALLASGEKCELREVSLKNKPVEMIVASEKATVPVLVLEGGQVVDESLDIMDWATENADPRNWREFRERAASLIAENDGQFKYHLDHYKYPNRYEDTDPIEHRSAGEQFLIKLNDMLAKTGFLFGSKAGFADHAIFPFIRQFANHDRLWFDALELPHLQTWLEERLTSEIFTVAMAKHKPWQAGDAELLFG